MASSTPRLSEVARHLVYPEGIKRTVWPDIRDNLADMGVTYDGWQQGAAQIILGLDEHGRYAATVGGVTMSLPRQVGKTFTVGSLLVAMCLTFPGLRVVWTSHHLRTTTNTFRSMQGMVRRKKVFAKLAPNGIRTANGEQEIRFANGSIIMFGAREHGFGVGIDAIDVMVCDEAQRLTSRALADMMPTTNQARHEHGALVFFIGTPPRPTDAGDEFAARRRKAINGKMANGIYVELSADPDADPDDPEQWAKANASYPHRTPHESMLRLRENLTDDGDWLREALGIWDADDATLSVIPEWPGLAGDLPTAPEGGALAVACDVEETRAVLCWSSSGEQPHVAVNDARPWTARNAFAAHVAEVQKRLGCPVVVRAKSTLIPALEDAGVDLTLAARDDRIQAASDFALACQRRDLRHGDYDELNAAVAAAKWRTTDGRRVLVDLIGDLEAATLALWGTSVVATYDPLASIF